ncbi:MAG: hypothetical protein HYU66_17225 [Armatimonadetes bacterium]|nr:hypothetical protein [Armatimonadota bacterium]
MNEPDAAREHYERALHKIRDPAERLASEGRLVSEEGLVADELEAEVLLALCGLLLDADDPDRCTRYAMQAVELDRHNVEGYYYQAAAMLRKGISSDQAAELLMKALMEGNDAERVLAWVEELMPEHLPWFRRIEE